MRLPRYEYSPQPSDGCSQTFERGKTPCQGGAFVASLQEPMHNPGQIRSVQVLVNEFLETLIHGDTGLVIEGQDLHENHSRNFLLRIHPEVVSARPDQL